MLAWNPIIANGWGVVGLWSVGRRVQNWALKSFHDEKIIQHILLYTAAIG